MRRGDAAALEEATLAECMALLVCDAISACGVEEDERRAAMRSGYPYPLAVASSCERRRFVRSTPAARVKAAFLRRCREIDAGALIWEQRAERGNVRALNRGDRALNRGDVNAAAKLERALQRILTALSVAEGGGGRGGGGGAAAGVAAGALHRLLQRVGEEMEGGATAAAAAAGCAPSGSSVKPAEHARGEGGLKRRRRARPLASARAVGTAALAASPRKRSRTAAEGGGDEGVCRRRQEHAGVARCGGRGARDAMLVDVPDFGALRISASAAAAAAAAAARR